MPRKNQKPPFPWTPELDMILIRGRKAGLSNKILAVAIGCNPPIISRRVQVLRQKGIDVPLADYPAPIKINPDRVDAPAMRSPWGTIASVGGDKDGVADEIAGMIAQGYVRV